MDTKRKRFIFFTVLYEVVLFGICLLLEVLLNKYNEGITGVSIIFFCVLGLPFIVANDYFYGLFDKDNRIKLKEEKEELKRKNASIRYKFDLPSYIETQYESRLVTKPRLIIAIVILAMGLIITIGSGIIFSLIKYENFVLEMTLIMLGLMLIVYAVFVAFNKLVWGVIHAITPMVCFFLLPSILFGTKFVENDLLLILLGVGPGLVFYSIFIYFAVVRPRKRIKIATEAYIKDFEMKNEGYEYKKFCGGLHCSCYESLWFYNKNNGKRLTIFFDDKTSHIVISADVKQGKYLLQDVPVLFEQNVEANKDLIKRIDNIQ